MMSKKSKNRRLKTVEQKVIALSADQLGMLLTQVACQCLGWSACKSAMLSWSIDGDSHVVVGVNVMVERAEQVP